MTACKTQDSEQCRYTPLFVIYSDITETEIFKYSTCIVVNFLLLAI